MNSFGTVVIHDIRTQSETARGWVIGTEIGLHGGIIKVLSFQLDTGYEVRLYLSPPELERLAKLLVAEQRAAMEQT